LPSHLGDRINPRLRTALGFFRQISPSY